MEKNPMTEAITIPTIWQPKSKLPTEHGSVVIFLQSRSNILREIIVYFDAKWGNNKGGWFDTHGHAIVLNHPDEWRWPNKSDQRWVKQLYAKYGDPNLKYYNAMLTGVICPDDITRDFTAFTFMKDQVGHSKWIPADPTENAAWEHMCRAELANNPDFTPGSVIIGEHRIAGFRNTKDNKFTPY
jgi:hypothetical protein